MNKNSLSILIFIIFFVLVGGLYIAHINNSPIKGSLNKERQSETLAQFPHGTWLENGVFTADGTLYVTSYFEKKIYAYKKGQGIRTFAQLPFYPVGIATTHQGFILSAHGIPFTQGSSFTSSNEIAVLNADGKITKTIAAPSAKFFNGVIPLSDRKYLIADSLAGTIWEFDPQGESITPWLQDDSLAPNPDVKGFALGANGVRSMGSTVFISNSSRGTIVSLNIEHALPKEPVHIFAKTGTIDDFAIAKDGTIYAASQGPALMRISPHGDVSDVITKGCDACSAVLFDQTDRTGKHIIFLTTGNFFEDKKTPARIVRLQIQ